MLEPRKSLEIKEDLTKASISKSHLLKACSSKYCEKGIKAKADKIEILENN